MEGEVSGPCYQWALPHIFIIFRALAVIVVSLHLLSHQLCIAVSSRFCIVCVCVCVCVQAQTINPLLFTVATADSCTNSRSAPSTAMVVLTHPPSTFWLMTIMLLSELIPSDRALAKATLYRELYT